MVRVQGTVFGQTVTFNWEITGQQKKDSRATPHTQKDSLPLLPSGPDGVRDFLLHRTRLSHLNLFYFFYLKPARGRQA